MLLPPDVVLNTDLNKAPRNRNLVKEMDVNFKIIANRWIKRREEQFDQADNHENRYPFTFMIDCLIEECKLNSNVSKFLKSQTDSKNEDEIINFYPPRSFNVTDKMALILNFKLTL